MNVFKKSLVAAIASGVVLAGAQFPAGAQQIENGLDLSTIKSLVQSDARTNLTIHKHEGAGIGTNDGLEKQIDRPAVQGAQFTIWQVPNVDLTTDAGWRQARDLSANVNSANPDSYRKVGEATTDANGQVTFDNLPVGLFYVAETKAAPGYNLTVAPFYVALPKTDPVQRQTRLENVHIYAKNTKRGDVVKTVKDANKNAGDQAEYTITADVPQGNTVHKMAIGDIYDPARLAFAGNETVTVTQVGGANDGTVFTEGTDYTVTDGTVTRTEDRFAGKRVTTVEFTEAGRAKLEQGTKIAAKYGFVIQEVQGDPSAAIDPIDNLYDVRTQTDGQGDPGNPGNPPEDPNNPPSIPEEPPVKTFLGKARIHKVAKEGDTKGLEGAVFDVYRCNDIQDLEAAPIVAGLTTDADGYVTTPSLHANDFVDNVAQKSNPGGYCLVETKSPNGFELLAQPVYFEILSQGGNVTDVQLKDIELVNVEDNAGFNLPLTGGQGVAFLLAGGALLIIAGGAYYYATRRRQEA